MHVADHHSSVSSQWLDGDEAEDEGVAEEEDEAGVAQEDDHQAAHLLATTSLFVQDFFFLFSQRKPFVNFHVFLFKFCFSFLYNKILI